MSHPSHRPGSQPTFASYPERQQAIDIGFVHVGKPVSERQMEGVWECADDCPHPDHATAVSGSREVQ